MAEMKLWLLTREKPDRDEFYGFVVRARSAEAARYQALIAAGIDDEPWWGDPELTTCVEVSQDGPPGVVLDSLRSG